MQTQADFFRFQRFLMSEKCKCQFIPTKSMKEKMFVLSDLLVILLLDVAIISPLRSISRLAACVCACSPVRAFQCVCVRVRVCSLARTPRAVVFFSFSED